MARPSHGRHDSLVAWIDAVGIVAPGLENWKQAAARLTGREAWSPTPATLAMPPILPPAERRRTGAAVKAALISGHQAVTDSSYGADALVSVFSSSGGDGDNCHAICEALASEDRRISPTRFHNSVHNAPAGYWSIAMSARPASTSLCAYDASFAAGLLEALCEVASARHPSLLVAYDAPYRDPLCSTRPMEHAFGLALVLSPEPTRKALGRIDARLERTEPTQLAVAGLENLRRSVPTARGLTLLAALAELEDRGPSSVALDYLDDLCLAIEVSPG